MVCACHSFHHGNKQSYFLLNVISTCLRTSETPMPPALFTDKISCTHEKVLHQNLFLGIHFLTWRRGPHRPLLAWVCVHQWPNTEARYVAFKPADPSRIRTRVRALPLFVKGRLCNSIPLNSHLTDLIGLFVKSNWHPGNYTKRWVSSGRFTDRGEHFYQANVRDANVLFFKTQVQHPSWNDHFTENNKRKRCTDQLRRLLSQCGAIRKMHKIEMQRQQG